MRHQQKPIMHGPSAINSWSAFLHPVASSLPQQTIDQRVERKLFKEIATSRSIQAATAGAPQQVKHQGVAAGPEPTESSVAAKSSARKHTDEQEDVDEIKDHSDGWEAPRPTAAAMQKKALNDAPTLPPP